MSFLGGGALALSRSEGSDVDCGYPDPGGSVGFPGTITSGKSQAACLGSTSVASVHWLCCKITVTMVKAKDLWMYSLCRLRRITIYHS